MVSFSMPIGFDDVITFENLYFAWLHFKSGKSQRYDVSVFEREFEMNLLSLLSDLSDGTYSHGGYQTFEVSDSKRRRIDKASVRDRVVHELLFRYLESIYDNKFISDSFSSRVGKGTLAALDRADRFLCPWRKGDSGWCVVLGDIRSFFANVPHQKLLELISRRVSDEKIMWIIDTVINSFDSYGHQGFGMPLGNVTSQIFANIILHEVDIAAKHRLRLKRYARYNDDVLVVSRGIESAKTIVCELKSITKLFGLDIKLRILKFNDLSQFDWLGANFSKRGRSIRSYTAVRIRKAIKRIGRRMEKRVITENEYRQSLLSYRAHNRAFVFGQHWKELSTNFD